MSKYKITCLECNESDIHTIDEVNHLLTFSEKVLKTNIIGTRWRKNNTMGYHCKCGNWNLLCQEEEKDFDRFVTGDPITLKKFLESLLIPDNKQFRMEII